MTVHTCHETVDPRRAGYCACGRRLVQRERNREFERLLTQRITGDLPIDPEPLIVFAERRADKAQAEYGHDFPSLERDLALEALDELGDARNYIVWLLDAIHRELTYGGGRVEHLQQALKYVALAFEEVRQAR